MTALPEWAKRALDGPAHLVDLAEIRDRAHRDPESVTRRIGPELEARADDEHDSTRQTRDQWMTVRFLAALRCWFEHSPDASTARQTAELALSSANERIADACAQMSCAISRAKTAVARSRELGHEPILLASGEFAFPDEDEDLIALRHLAIKVRKRAQRAAKYQAETKLGTVPKLTAALDEALGFQLSHAATADWYRLVSGLEISEDAIRKARVRRTGQN